MTSKHLFSERDVQFSGIWHFSERMYAQVLHQSSRLSIPSTVVGAGALEQNTRLSSLLLSYQANWQTRYFVGVQRRAGGDTETAARDPIQVFAKLAYLLLR